MKVSTSDKTTISYEPGTECPICGAKVWDNRQNKRNPKGPDFKCADKDQCGFAMWLVGEKRYAPKPTGTPVDPSIGMTSMEALLRDIFHILEKIEKNTRTKVDPDWDSTSLGLTPTGEDIAHQKDEL